MISRSQMNRQLYQMGGEGMQAGIQEDMQGGIMQMAPQEMQPMQDQSMQPQMQSMQAPLQNQEQPQLDPNQAIEILVRMLMEQGIPQEEAIKIAMQMIQAVSEGGMQEVSDDTRIEARFGGRIGYAGGGISRLVDRQGYFLGSVFKGITKGVKGIVKGVTSAVKKVASSDLGKIALAAAAIYAGGGGFSPGGFSMFGSAGSSAGGLLGAGGQFSLGNSYLGQQLLGTQVVDGIGKEGFLAKMGLGRGYGANPLSGISSLIPGKESLLAAGAGFLGGSLAGMQPPKQEPGESLEDYEKRVEEYKKIYQANLSGKNPPRLIAGANNPYYPVYAANGGRIGYLLGGSGVASAVAQPVDGQPMPISGGGGKGIGGMLRNLIANNPEIFRQVTSQQTMSPMQQSSGPIPLGLVNYSGTPYENAIKKTSVAQPTVGGSTYSSGGGFGGLGVGSNLIKQITQQSFFNTNEDEEDTRYKLPASARNPFYGAMMANGGRMGYAMGNSVQEGIMAAPQIASQMGMPVGNPRMNEGGVPELDYRDEGGFVPPIGIKERADDIPAMLSNNEFVFTANAVKNAGGGDPNVGAQKMYTLMKRLENGGRV
jgi:hypothetical protein